MIAGIFIGLGIAAFIVIATFKGEVMPLQRNRHPSGRISDMTFGLCSIADGLVRVLSFGFLHSTFALDHARRSAKNHLNKLKADKPRKEGME